MFDFETFIAMQPDVIVISVSIMAFKKCMASILPAFDKLKKTGTNFKCKPYHIGTKEGGIVGAVNHEDGVLYEHLLGASNYNVIYDSSFFWNWCGGFGIGVAGVVEASKKCGNMLTSRAPFLFAIALFVDVLSVKSYPKQHLLEILPKRFNILCTHPMFGPDSGKYTWEKLPCLYEKVRVNDAEGASLCQQFLDIFGREKCKMVEMSCEQHDEYAASSQFITHLTGRILGRQGLVETPINTQGYNSLLELVDTTTKDSFDLFYGLYKFNPNSKSQLHKFMVAFQDMQRQIDVYGTSKGDKKVLGSLVWA
jgi:hypothetical protein